MTGVIPQEAAQVRAAYRAGELTPVDVLDATLAKIGRAHV